MKKWFHLLILFFSTLSIQVWAEAILPENLTVIEEEAFSGDVYLKNIVIPEFVTEIDAHAFADTALQTISIPPTVISIAEDAFEGIKTPMLITCSPDSYAVRYALHSNLDFRADTVCRALIIGQTDYPYPYKLEGTQKDIKKVYDALNEFDITLKQNLKADEIIDAISMAFADAEEEDISLLYYCGHGNESDGALVGIDMSSNVTATELRLALDKIPGRKIVLIDACYSGALIGRATEQANHTDPALIFVYAFSGKSRSLDLSEQQYFVLASSKGSEESWEASYGGLFTDAFVKSKTFGDDNMDGVVSFEEAFQYTKEKVYKTATAGGKIQSVQVYPENCFWFGLFR